MINEHVDPMNQILVTVYLNSSGIL